MPKNKNEAEENISDLAPTLPNIKKLLEVNIEWAEVNHAILKKISRRLLWFQISGWIKLAIIIAPILLGIIYLKPIIDDIYVNLIKIIPGINTGELSGLMQQFIKK